MVIQIPGAAASDFVSYVQHGATASTARTAGADVVLWDGSVDPDNKVSGDYWWDTGNDAFKRYDGASWTSASGTYSVIAETVLGSDAATIDFTSIPSTYRNLQLVVTGKATAIASVTLRFNNDSGANYDHQRHRGTGASSLAAESLGGTSMTVGGVSNAANVASITRVLIGDYASTTFQKAAVSQMTRKDGTSTGNLAVEQYAGFWRSTAAINRVTLLLSAGNYSTGTVATLYGIGGA